VRSPLRRAIAATAFVAGSFSLGGVAAASSDPTQPETTVAEPTGGGPSTVVENEFMPENADLSDCISALPRPECGSNARGGWRQTLIFAVLTAVLAIGGWRIVTLIRRRDQAGVDEVARIDAQRALRANEDRIDENRASEHHEL